MTVLRTAYVMVLPNTDKLEPEMVKALRRIDLTAPAGKVGDSAGSTLGKRMSGALTAAFAAAGIGAAISGAITSGLDVGAANDKLRAQLRLTGQESAKLGKTAGELYSSNYGESMGQVNDAISSVISNVKSMRTASVSELKAVTAGAMDIVRVFDQDLPGVTAAVGSLMQSGLAKDAKGALDIITTGFQEGLDKGGDFLDTLTEYSVQFTKMGLDGKTSLGVINQLLAGGARSSDLAADAIKEFSIRSIDGSKATGDAFKALGMDAKGMAVDFASGGPAAKKAFGLVVGELNAIKDPLKRNSIGVALFGTQWEDLGDAFRNLDVSAATDDIGKLGDATKGIADQSAQGRIQSFIRTVQTGFVGVVGGQVIPKVTEFVDRLRTNKELMDRLRSAGTTLVDNLKSIGSAVGSVVGWFREHDTVAKALLITVGLVTAATQAHAAVLAVQAAGGLASYIMQIRVVSAVTKAWSAVTWLLNAAMSANPVTLVIIGLVALGAALVVAYKKSETFRSIVQGAWTGIKAAASAVGAWFTGTLWPSLKKAYDQLSSAALWLWHNAILPAWNGIKSAIQGAWSVIQSIFQAIKGFVTNTLMPIFQALYNNVIKPVWAGIQWAIKAAWVVIQIIFAAIKLYLTNVLFPVFRFLYNNVIKPVWGAIQWAIKSAWGNIQTVFAAIKLYLTNVVFPVFRFLHSNVIKPVFSAVSSTISTVWEKGIKPVFSALGGFIKNNVAPAFRTGVGAIASAWDKLKSAATAPVRFVVDQVLNKGIIGGINWLAKAVGVKDRIPTINWGGGGGGGGSKPQGDKISGNLRGDGYGQGDGKGIGDGLGSVLAGPGKWLSDRAGLGRIVGKFGSNPFTGMVAGAAGKAKDFALEKVKALAGELLGRSGGGGSVGAGGLRSGIAGALAALRSTFGDVPLISGARPGSRTLSGNVSYHASGRAIDIAPVEAWAAYLNSTYGPQLKELITPFPQYNLLNGRPHTYTGAIWQQHNFQGGNAHVHAAMANGGVIHEPVFGVGKSGRTYAFGERGPETVTPGVGSGRQVSVVNNFTINGGSRSPREIAEEVSRILGRQANIYSR